MKTLNIENISLWILSWIFTFFMIAASEDVPNCSKMLKFEQILSRKKRYLFFPPGSAVQTTVAIAKAIATDFPRGVNYIAEGDLYYPLPNKIADWYPKPLKPKSRIDNVETINTPTDHNKLYPWASDSGYLKQPKGTWENSNIYQNKTQQQYNQIYEYRKPPRVPTQAYTINRNSPSLIPLSRHDNFKKDFYYEDWKRNRGYRERRNIYDHFESLAKQNGFDMKACLLRLICEVRHFILPEGKSFFHDALRIFFYVPIHHSVNDEYTSAMRAEEGECLSSYKRDCKYSILALLMNRQKHSLD